MHILPILTERERQILPFVVSGATRDEIAHHFGISEETIKTHLKNIFKKFNVANLRDGFEDIQKYQRNFGIGGLGVAQYTKDYVARIEIDPNRRSYFQTCHLQSVCMLPEISNLFVEFREHMQPKDFHTETGSVSVQTDTVRRRIIYRVKLPQPVKFHQEFEFSFNVQCLAGVDLDPKVDVTDFVYPAAKRTLEYVFSSDDMPANFSHSVRVGKQVVAQSNFTQVLEGTSYILATDKDFTPSQLSAQWDYDNT